MGWWSRWWPFSRAARVERAQQIAPSVAELESFYGSQLRTLFGGTPPRRGDGELLRSYSSIPWLHAVVRRRAEAIAGTSWRLWKTKKGIRARLLPGAGARAPIRHRRLLELEKEGLVERVWDHELIALLDRPSHVMTGRAFWELTSIYDDLLGEVFWGVDREDGKKPSALWQIVPTTVQRRPTTESPYYTIRAAQTLIAHERDVVWMRRHDPNDPYSGRGVGTAGALGDELETDEYMATMAKARFFNRSAPEVLIGIIGASSEQVDKLADDIEAKHRGSHKAGQTHIVGKDFRAQTISHTMVESQYVDGRKLLRDFTMQVFGVPPEILGVLENSNRSTIDAADYLFSRFCTEPALDRHRAEIQAWIAPEFGEDLLVDFESPVAADVEAETKVMIALPGAFTLDEVRARGGRPPLPDDAGKLLMTPPGAGGAKPIVPVEGAQQENVT